MKTFVDNEPQEVRIEIIPLVDVVFCVLTFFILAAVGLTRVQGIGLDLPETQTAKSRFGDKLVLQVNSVGEIFIENQPVSNEILQTSLSDFRRNKPAGLIVIDADRQASYDKVITLLDILRQLQITNVALGSKDAPTKTPPGTFPFPIGPSPNLGTPVIPNTAPISPGIGVPPPGQPPLTPIQPTPGTVPNNNLPAGTASPATP